MLLPLRLRTNVALRVVAVSLGSITTYIVEKISMLPN